MIHLRIYGQTPSKKSSQQIIVNKKTKRAMLIPNKKYNEWIGGAKKQLWDQMEDKGFETIDTPVAIKCIVYRLTKRKIDLINLLQSIHDALEAAGILKNDFLIESTDGSRRILGVAKGQERTEIFIYPFS
jgi:Holliday junction resolvase RusA-like endonuclease